MQSNHKVKFEFPRKKKSLSSLNQLMKDKVPLPSQSISRRLFPNQPIVDYRSKTSDLHRRTKSQLKPSSNTLMNFKQSSRQLKSNMLGQLRKTWHPKDDFQSTFRSVGSLPKFRSLQLKIDKNNSPTQVILPSSKINSSKSFVSSDINFHPTHQPIKNSFLKKGTSINRQVVANLVRIKIGRQREQQNEKIRNEQIIKMIKLYKGYGQIESDYNLLELRESKKQKSKLVQNELEKSFDKEIKGWLDNKQQEFQI